MTSIKRKYGKMWGITEAHSRVQKPQSYGQGGTELILLCQASQLNSPIQDTKYKQEKGSTRT